jgi:hypothetical protein
MLDGSRRGDAAHTGEGTLTDGGHGRGAEADGPSGAHPAPLLLAHALRAAEEADTALAFAITVIFGASVDVQGGAYATGVLVIMTSAAFAVMLSALWKDESLAATLAFGLVTLIFVYTLVANIIERPDGIKIASFFIAPIIVVSLSSHG